MSPEYFKAVDKNYDLRSAKWNLAYKKLLNKI